MRLGHNLRAARKAAKMSMEFAATWSGIARSHLSDIERSKHEPRLLTLRKLAATYGVSVSELIGESQIRKEVLTAQERAVLAALRGTPA